MGVDWPRSPMGVDWPRSPMGATGRPRGAMAIGVAPPTEPDRRRWIYVAGLAAPASW